jgi:hypothetical protein
LFLNRFVYHPVGKPEQLIRLTLQLNLHLFFRQYFHSEKKAPLAYFLYNEIKYTTNPFKSHGLFDKINFIGAA